MLAKCIEGGLMQYKPSSLFTTEMVGAIGYSSHLNPENIFDWREGGFPRLKLHLRLSQVVVSLQAVLEQMLEFRIQREPINRNFELKSFVVEIFHSSSKESKIQFQTLNYKRQVVTLFKFLVSFVHRSHHFWSIFFYKICFEDSDSLD